MRFDIFTLFPDAFEWLLGQRSFRKSGEEGAEFTLRDYRTWTPLKGGRVDDSPYGGGPGMVMKAPVWGAALDDICSPETLLVVPSPAASITLLPTAS